MVMEAAHGLDAARRTWFGGGGPAPDPALVADACGIRREIIEDDMPRGEAVEVAHLIECYHGFPMFEGVVLDLVGDPICVHAWNVLPDGGILDATADLNGSQGPVWILPGDRAMLRYRREWTDDYNPSLADRFPELEGQDWDGRTDIARFVEDLSAPSPSPGLR